VWIFQARGVAEGVSLGRDFVEGCIASQMTLEFGHEATSKIRRAAPE
jgi:hypothetical protein